MPFAFHAGPILPGIEWITVQGVCVNVGSMLIGKILSNAFGFGSIVLPFVFDIPIQFGYRNRVSAHLFQGNRAKDPQIKGE